MKEARIEIRIKNNLLYKRIFSEYNSLTEFSKKIGMSLGLINGLINLKLKPYGTDNKPTKSATEIANFFYEEVEILFPRKLYKIKANRIIIESEIQSIQHNARLKLEMQDPENILLKKDLNYNIKKVLSSLTDSERKIIEMRYYEGLSLEACGKRSGVGKERCRQIEKKALRRLRHPSRYLYLEEFRENLKN